MEGAAPGASNVAPGHDGAALRVIQVTKVAQGGGAERIASQLHRGLLRRGHESWMATAKGSDDDPTILAIPGPSVVPASGWTRRLRRTARAVGPKRGGNVVQRSVQRALRTAAAPRPFVYQQLGRELFDYPGTAFIPEPASRAAGPRPLPQPARWLLRPAAAGADQPPAAGRDDAPRRVDVHRALRLHARL